MDVTVEPDDTNIVSVHGLGFRYTNGTQAIGDVSFDLKAGRNTAIVGPSGCGKSTLLAILAGLERATSGLVTWSDATGRGQRRSLSMMFQRDTLLPWLTVAQNVALFSKFQPTPRKVVTERVATLLEMVGLTDAARMYPYQLSGGMRRRVAFLAAVAPYPKLLLLDEPFSSLDEPTRVAILQDVFRIGGELDMGMVLVTHDLGEAVSLSDEVVMLSRGPSTVVGQYRVPFDRNRDMLTLRQEPEFLTLYGQLWHDLSAQIIASRQASTTVVEPAPMTDDLPHELAHKNPAEGHI